MKTEELDVVKSVIQAELAPLKETMSELKDAILGTKEDRSSGLLIRTDRLEQDNLQQKEEKSHARAWIIASLTLAVGTLATVLAERYLGK
jgi:hypothetical protein